MPEHNISSMALGIFILWFGWYGFNCGSTLGIIGSGGIAAKVAVNTTVAASGGCLVGIIVAYRLERTFNVCVAMNGILAGLVSITASCAFVDPWMAFIIGTVGSSIHYAARRLLHKLQIDDPLDAVPIHLFGGSWGLLCSGIFCTDQALQYAGYPNANDACASGRQFGTQFIGLLIITSWSAFFAVVYWQIAKVVVGLRVSAEMEEMGERCPNATARVIVIVDFSHLMWNCQKTGVEEVWCGQRHSMPAMPRALAATRHGDSFDDPAM